MALVDCSECGNTVSEKATACPHCGAPVEAPAGNEFKFSSLQPTKAPTRRPSWTLLGGGTILLVLLFIVFIKPRLFPSAEQIGETTRALMQEKFDTDPAFKKFALKVQHVAAIKRADNTYEGIATVTYEGETHDVSVEIVANSDGIMWKTEPGALMFVAQRELRKAFR